MALGTFTRVLEYARPAERHLQASFGLDASTAAGVVQEVLLRFYRSGPEQLEHPRGHFFRACRWRAIQILSRRKRRDKAQAVIEKRRQEAERKDREVLVALEDEDKPKFFDQATPKQREVFELIVEGHSQAEVSAILEIPESTVRMRLHLARKRLGSGAA
jgi:RNA polymerase sigma factor (sigma-70 family)